MQYPSAFRVATAAFMVGAGAFAQALDLKALEFFEGNVRPVLAKACYGCHGPAVQASSLRLDSRAAILQGGNRGPALIPGKPAESLLSQAIRHKDLKMPVGGKLADSEIAAIEKWIGMGAPWPADGPKQPTYYEKLIRTHWAFQPVRASREPIDWWIRQALGKAGLKPSPAADRATLIRRLSLVLTGLPPAPLEVDLFVRDQSAGAYERLVDRLLQSPHYGERWARHWMDVMRFAETFGNDWNYEILGAWQYRDYLIRAFNNDVPYDRLIREHVAGDLLPKPRVNREDQINESVIGTMFYRLGELGHDDCIRFRQIRTDVVDNQIDTLGKAFQGLTIACARCHDHKLDPIPTADYYALYGMLTSSRMVTRTADLPEVNAATRERLAAMKPRIRAELARVWREEAREIPRYLLAASRAWKKLPPEAGDSQLPAARIQALIDVLGKPKLEEPLSLWARVANGESWKTLTTEYTEGTEARKRFNREHFTAFDSWSMEGNAAGSAKSADGEFAVASTGPAAVSGIFPAGIYSHTLSERLNLAARSPLVPKDKKFVSLLVMGGKLGARRAVLDNCMLSEDYTALERNTLEWVKIPNRDDQPNLPFYLEMVTKSDNTRIPDRPGRLKATPEQLAAPESYFGIARAVLHDVDETPRPELDHLMPLFAGAPSDLNALAGRYAAVAEKAIGDWEQGRASAEDVTWLQWLLERKLLTNSAAASGTLKALIADYRAEESRIAAPRVIQGLADLDPGYDFPVLIGGDASRPGKTPPRGYLSLFATSRGSGRLEMAESIASAANPLTARVMANRIWQHLFGRGIVATSDNFGTYGEVPSHPELLDSLAAKFVNDGWSIKKLIREIVLSETFRQGSTISPQAEMVDPLNRLLSHYPVRRMEAESIRDAILAVSGRLDRTMYGPSIQPHRDEPKDYRKLHQGPLDGEGRRSIYTKVTRHEGSRFLETFDFPNPNIARGNRDASNVPPQALALMNDPFVVDQAAFWAERLVADGAASMDARIDFMFRAALGRLPDDAEHARFGGLAKELASLHKVDSAKILASKSVWKDMAHAVFNLKEFIYVR